MKNVNTKNVLKFLLSMSVAGMLTVWQAALAQGARNEGSAMLANQSAQKEKQPQTLLLATKNPKIMQ